jgi:hypothetical protein
MAEHYKSHVWHINLSVFAVRTLLIMNTLIIGLMVG